MSNPYFINEPAAVSFSGGRTSAYMLYKILEAHDGKLPDFVKVTFANTGKEMPQTLDFVKRCGDEWGVDIVWVEARIRKSTAEEKNKFIYETVVVNHETASRNGEPFEQLLRSRHYAPNPIQRFCTAQLKVNRIQQYLQSVGITEHTQYIGIRADESRRAVKIHNQKTEGHECYCPLFVDGVRKEDVGSFWGKQSFDLDLPNNNGVTDWGNCDLCFLKGRSKKMSIIRARPDLADWWIKQEEWLGDNSSMPDGFAGDGAFFRKDQPSYKDMLRIATDQQDMFADLDDESIPCFCGD